MPNQPSSSAPAYPFLRSSETPLRLWAASLVATGLLLCREGLAADANNVPTAAVQAPAADTVALSPFVVNTESDDGWVASSTLSGQRTQEQLSNLPITVFGMTDQFMKDLNLFSLEDASRWVAGLSVTDYSARRTDDQLTSYRGSTTGDRATTQSSRNFFSWFSPTDQYNIDRIDFNFGSNSLMYGDATPGGLPTTYTKVPQFTNFGTVFASIDSYASYRFQLDINRRINDQWAIRINAVDRDRKSFVDFDENGLKAWTAAVVYKPFTHTAIRTEFEEGEYRRVRSTDEAGIQTTSAPGKGYNSTGWYYTSDGNIINNTVTGTVAAADKTGPGGTNYSFLQGQSATVNVKGVATLYNAFNKELNLLGVGDYINRPYKNATAWLDQSFGKLNIEASYNFQREDQKRNDTDFGGTGSGADAGAVISVDGDGRPYVDMVTPQPKVYSVQSRNYRVSATYPFDFGKWMKQYLVLSASNEQDMFNTTRYNMANFAGLSSANPLITNNKIIFRAYLDSPGIYSRDFWNRFSFQTKDLPNTSTFQPGYYYSSDPNAPWVDVRYLKTMAASTSGQYLNGKLRTLFGIRRDVSRRKRLVTQPNDAIGQAIFVGGPDADPSAYAYDPEYQIQNTTYQAGLVYNLFTTTTNSLNVYADYSTSYHFQGFEKFNGQTLGPVLGETREIGLKGNTLSNFVTYTVSFYRTYKKNAAFAWSNPSGFTTAGTGTANSMQTLFNPIGLDPSDPSYFTVATGNNSEDHTTSANEKYKGVELSLQSLRIHGVQILLNGSYNEVSANRDFSDFQTRLNAALARQTTYLAAGQAGYSQALITGAQTLLANNLGINSVSGSREAPRSANVLVDYAFSPETFLNGTRLGVGGNWTSKYNLSASSSGTITGDSRLPLTAYFIHQRKILGYVTEFRLGATNICDLEYLGKKYRTIGITTQPVGGVSPAVYQYAYLPPLTLNFSTTVHF